MIVIVAGMQRSGSTFVFNITRELLAQSGPVLQRACNSLPPLAERLVGSHLILKTHAPDEEVRFLIASGRVKVICTYRRPEDAVASWMDTFGFGVEESISEICDWIDWHRSQRGDMHNLSYDLIQRDPQSAVSGIQHYLRGSIDRDLSTELVAQYSKQAMFERASKMAKTDHMVDVGFSYYDPTTFIHRRHVRSLDDLKATDTLSKRELRRVRSAFANRTHNRVYRPVGEVKVRSHK